MFFHNTAIAACGMIYGTILKLSFCINMHQPSRSISPSVPCVLRYFSVQPLHFCMPGLDRIGLQQNWQETIGSSLYLLYPLSLDGRNDGFLGIFPMVGVPWTLAPAAAWWRCSCPWSLAPSRRSSPATSASTRSMAPRRR